MKKIMLTILMFTMLNSGLALAASETGKIIQIIYEGSSVVSIFLDGVDDKSQCSGGGRWTIYKSDGLFKEKVASLMAAATTGKKVNLYMLDSQTCGGWDSNTIYYVRTYH